MSPTLTPADGFRTASFEPDEVVAGRFRVLRRIAKGGTGEVYLAHDLDLETSVALKTLLPQHVREERLAARFLREVQLARRVTHPNVCRIFDVFRHRPEAAPGRSKAEVVVASMEYLEGETLSERLEHRGRLPQAEVAPIIAQVAAGLAAAHELGIVHRDLKAANVMIVEGTLGERAVITDFGLATVDRTLFDSKNGRIDTLTDPGSMIGTPVYMAPEQLLGDRATPLTDVHALGLLAYELLTGRLPFSDSKGYAAVLRRLSGKPKPPRELIPDLDPRWEEAILRSLAFEAEERFPTVLDFAAALDPDFAETRERRPSLERVWSFANFPVSKLGGRLRRLRGSSESQRPATTSPEPARRDGTTGC